MPKEVEIQVTRTFKKNEKAYNDINNDVIVNMGGSRSSKTYSISQLLILECLTHPGITVDVVRLSFPALRASVYKDMMEILGGMGIYNEKNHNKTSHAYKFPNGSTINWYSAGDSQKIRGRKRDILFLNESNELDYETYMQFKLRTTGKVFIDFNPSDHQSWIYNLMEDPRTCTVKSTYKDNTFLPQSQIDFIENLINVDENYYRIYALGERPIASNRVYSHFQTYKEQPKEEDLTVFGLDFGFNHPTALVRVTRSAGAVWIKEEIYSSGLTEKDLLERMSKIPDLRSHKIYADSARPDIIESIRRAGYQCRPAEKSVKDGINEIKASKIFVHEESINIMNEYNKYSWKMDGERVLDEVVKLHDDAMDAIRYAVYTSKKKEVNPSAIKFY